MLKTRTWHLETQMEERTIAPSGAWCSSFQLLQVWTGFASELNQLPCASWSWYQKEDCRSLLSTSLSLFFLDYAVPGHLIWFFLHLLSQVSSTEDWSECQGNVKSSIYCYPSIRETTWGPYSDLLKSCLDDCGGLVYPNLASAMSTIATYLL